MRKLKIREDTVQIQNFCPKQYFQTAMKPTEWDTINIF